MAGTYKTGARLAWQGIRRCQTTVSGTPTAVVRKGGSPRLAGPRLPGLVGQVSFAKRVVNETWQRRPKLRRPRAVSFAKSVFGLGLDRWMDDWIWLDGWVVGWLGLDGWVDHWMDGG